MAEKDCPCGKNATGIFAVDTGTYEVLYLNDEMRQIYPEMREGIRCYEAFGKDSRCADCPLEHRQKNALAVRFRGRNQTANPCSDVFAVRIRSGSGRLTALVCYGYVNFVDRKKWLEDELYQTILRQTHAVVFEYDVETGESYISPIAGERLTGNYDGRRMSEVLVQDGVIFQEDLQAFLEFRGGILSHETCQEMTLRLKCLDGTVRWHKMSVWYFSEEHGNRIIVGMLIDVDDEVRLRESLRRRAEFDMTSGIFNKDTFYRETEKLLREFPNVPRNFVRFDINRFKTVNEIFGISEGDRVLRYVGRIVKDLARENETYAHLGNDVFCMSLLRSDEETVQLIRELGEKVNAYPLDFHFILSAGIYRMRQYDGQPVSIICDRAALAQYSVKGNYIQRYAFYQDKMGNALSQEHFIIGSMHKALENHQFVIYLQPKYDMTTHQIFGAEALTRWMHPTKGMISPGAFIPLFERNGFILRLDEYIWESVCRMLRRWIDRGIQPVPVSVNVSRVHLYDPSFCDKLIAMLQKYRLDPLLVELEITESAYVENPESLYAIMDRLKSLGFLFSMDDFGSGYSSLNMLKDIPVDILKIDLNFLKESRRGKSTVRTILEATVGMAQKLEMPVIAEGVETPEQAETLLQVGCTKAQGYYFGRPMPVPEFEKILIGQGESAMEA